MKKALLGMVLGLMAAQAGAADAGLGLSLRSNDAWIYVPIDFGKVRIEPSVRYVETKSNSTSTDTSLFFPVTSTVKAKDRTYEFAFGVFGLADLMDNVSLYYGARAAHIDSTSEQKIRSQFSSVTDENALEVNSDGYRISPTLGFEYQFNKHFSIGGEAEWFYEDVETDFTQDDEEPGSGESSRTGTSTRVILRFYF